MNASRLSIYLIAPLLCCTALTDNQVVLVDDTQSPLTHTRLSIFIDDGVRCVTTPCPTDSRTWFGTTDENGTLKLPDWRKTEQAYLSVPGFKQVHLASRVGRLALITEVASSKSQLEVLEISYVSMGQPELSIFIRNFSDAPVTWVSPRPEPLEQYGSWGGWQLSITSKGERYEPEPLPAALPPATPEDLLVVPAGGHHEVRVHLGHWRMMPLERNVTIAERPASYDVELRWTGVPPHLKSTREAAPLLATTTLNVVLNKDY